MRTKNVNRAFILVVLALVATVGIGVVAFKPRVLFQTRYYPETDHTIREPFLTFFDDHGGVATFGFPLTEAYTDTGGTLVQTFQRAKLELSVQGVTLAPIGMELRLGDPAQSYAVNEAFTAFYNQHGGQSFFGQTLSSSHEENGLLVQDFERARMIQVVSGDIHLANLGSAYVMAYPPPNDSGRSAIRLNGTPTPPPSLSVNASVAAPTVTQGGEQTIFVYVEDDRGFPVQGAQTLAILRHDSDLTEIMLPETDTRGFSSSTFIVPPATPGSRVIVEIHVLLGETFLTIETTYFQWW